MRGMLPLVLAAVAAATSASAVNVTLVDQEKGFVGSKYVFISPVLIDGVLYDCISPNATLLQGTHPYDFSPQGPLTTSNALGFTGYNLDSTQIDAIANLLVKTQSDYTSGDVSLTMAADQAAIWEIEGQTVTPSNSALIPLIAADITFAENTVPNTSVTVVADTDGDTQALGTPGPGLGGGGEGGVPEPATWTLMLSGIGLLGGGLRARRRNGVATLAA